VSSDRRYTPVPPQVDLPAMERAVLALWEDAKTFDTSLRQTEGGPAWTFYEGPPTANGQPGVHHVEARVFKDVFPRFKTMQGYHVVRKAGWDCHGLPVEIAVEKELGFNGKGDIEAYGVAEFNARCRESVLRHVDEFEAMTRRLGFWVDADDPYRTMDPEYVQSVWWSLQQVYEKGLLTEDYRVAPYCPRCGTGLSDHELAQGYETVVDPSVYVRFPLTSGPYARTAALLVWTTTPWTLVSNTAVAVRPDVTYVTATNGAETLVVAEPLVEAALGEGWTVQDRFPGAEMERWSYERPLDLLDWPEGEDGHFVLLADYVTTEDGTGLVHQSPAFGAEDLVATRAYGLPVVRPVRPDGHFEESVRLVGGEFFKHADQALVKHLEATGRMFRHQAYEHAYPHCWRCHTALLYYAQPSWYVRTTQVKDALLAENERTAWYPENIKWGRYGDWLHNNIDWALSRSRYWGTPLPIWRCADDGTHLVCVGSLAELGELAGQDLSTLDPHRPYVDEVTLPCTAPGCGGTMHRVPEVIDAWYDSGSMPFAQWGYPHAPGSVEKFENAFPAQFICEAIDQTRGWFYTLMAVSTIVHGRSSYENVLCLGHIVAEDGRKMSKHLGNILLPMPLMEDHGADALRWFMAASGSPWLQRRVGHTVLQEIVRKTLLTYWNTASFLTLYAGANDWAPGETDPAVADRAPLDRWALSELHRLVGEVTAAYEAFDTPKAGRLLSAFVDDLSNWYVRRSRRRFWDGDAGALATLHECLRVLTLLLAPVVPFVTERVWQDVVRPVSDVDAPQSVHLASWPEPDPVLVDDDLAAQVALVRRVVELGRSARPSSKVRNRQPLGRALVGAAGWTDLPEALKQEVADELNVHGFDELAGELVDRSAKGNFRALGKRFGKDTPTVAAAVAAADAEELARSLRDAGTATVLVDGADVAVSADEVLLTETPREGWAVASEGGETVALDLEVTPALRRAGLAREVVRLVQEARKTSGLQVTDRVAVRWEADGELAAALREHAGLVAGEVLATSYDEGLDGADAPEHRDETLGLRFTVTRTAQ
jgi:isoleucyl-tRNA synthetase